MITTTIRNLFFGRERLWLIFMLNPDKNIGMIGFEVVGDTHSVGDGAYHYSIIKSASGIFVGFVHTHPGSDTTPSLSDRLTVAAWERALGKPLLNVVVSRNRKTYTVLYGGKEVPQDAIKFNWNTKIVHIKDLEAL